jgi:hypothetical protein
MAIDNANKKAWNGNYYSGYIFSNGNLCDDTVFKKNAFKQKKSDIGWIL